MMRETLSSLETYIAQNAELRARLELTERAGNSFQGAPPRPRAEDPIGTSRYAVEFCA